MAWHVTVVHPKLGREHDASSPAKDGARELARGVRHRVEHHAVGVERLHDLGELLIAALRPRVVIDEDPNAFCMKDIADVSS